MFFDRADGCYSLTMTYPEENVAPGQTATFVIESEHMEGAEDYSVDIYAFFALRAIDSEGEVWNVH